MEKIEGRKKKDSKGTGRRTGESRRDESALVGEQDAAKKRLERERERDAEEEKRQREKHAELWQLRGRREVRGRVSSTVRSGGGKKTGCQGRRLCLRTNQN